MIHLVVITHEVLNTAYQMATRHFFNELPHWVHFLSIRHDESPEQMTTRIQEQLNQIENADGTLILTDVFGATPSNKAQQFLNCNTFLITGLNIPMFVKAVQHAQDRSDLSAFAKEVRKSAIEGILLFEGKPC